MCDVCGMEGHYGRECDIGATIETMKNLDLRLQEWRKIQPCGQINSIDDPSDEGLGDEEYVQLEGNVEACVIEFVLPSGSSWHIPQPRSYSFDPIELNSVESSTVPSSTWYLDSGGTHHVSGNPNIFQSLRHTSRNNLQSAGGHGHSVTGIGHVHFQFLMDTSKVYPKLCILHLFRKLALRRFYCRSGSKSWISL
jgi:hypothetical protein